MEIRQRTQGPEGPPGISSQTAQCRGASAGTLTRITWTKIALAETYDPDGLIAVAASVVTLQPGTYRVRCVAGGRANSFVANNFIFVVRLRNTSDAVTVAIGPPSGRNDLSVASELYLVAHAEGIFTIAAAKTFELQGYWVDDAADGDGIVTSPDDVAAATGLATGTVVTFERIL